MDEHTIRLTEAERIVVIGGRLVGMELVGELTAFADDVLRFYPRPQARRGEAGEPFGGEVLGIVRGMQTLECLMGSITHI